MRIALLVAVGAAMLVLLGGAAGAQEWEMVAKDPLHSGAASAGPAAPLRRAWIRGSGHSLGSETTWPAIRDGVLYTNSGPGVLAAEARTGKKVWWKETPGGSGQVGPAVDDRAVYVPAPLEQVVALDRTTGEQIWSVPTGDTGGADPSPTLADGHLYFGLPDAREFYSIDVTRGALAWKVETEFMPYSVPAVANGIATFTTDHLGSPRALLLALNAADGSELWRAELEEGNSSPSILGDKVIVGNGDFFAYAFDLKTGRQVWRSRVLDKFDVATMPALAFGDVFLADRIGNLYRLDGVTGRRKWVFKDTIGAILLSSPVVAGKNVFIGTGAGWLYLLDADTGRLAWRERVGGHVLSGATDGERFYFGVKLRAEGLYAYEHDPTRPAIAPEPVSEEERTITELVGGLILLAVFAGAVWVVVKVVRRLRRRSA